MAAAAGGGGPGAGGALQHAGMAYQAVTSYKKAQTEKAALKYQARVARNNAQITGYEIDQTKRAGATAEQNSRLRTAAIFSAQRTALAANGIDLGEGNAADVLGTTKYLGERDALVIRDDTARREWALRIQQENYLDEERGLKATSNAIQPFMASIGSLLGNASTVAAGYERYQNKKPQAT